jgi:hypothetical protein
VIALVENEDLRFMLEPAECGGVNDAVAVPPKRAAALAGWLVVEPAAT